MDEKYLDVDTITMLDTDTKLKKKWLTINPKGCNKAATLRALASKINVDMSEIVFFGDATNDIDLIKQAGLGVYLNEIVDLVVV